MRTEAPTPVHSLEQPTGRSSGQTWRILRQRRGRVDCSPGRGGPYSGWMKSLKWRQVERVEHHRMSASCHCVPGIHLHWTHDHKHTQVTRIVTGTRKFDHITPVLRQLLWLPVRQRITFKLVMIAYKCLHHLAPSYLADVCVLFRTSSAGGSCGRRTAGYSSCRVQGLRSVGETSPCLARQHGTAFPSNWGLPPTLITKTFAKRLKSHLFGCYSASEESVWLALYSFILHSTHHEA